MNQRCPDSMVEEMVRGNKRLFLYVNFFEYDKKSDIELVSSVFVSCDSMANLV